MDVFKRRKLGIRFYANQNDNETLDPKKAIEFRGLPITAEITVSEEQNNATISVIGLPREMLINNIWEARSFRPDSWTPNVIELFSYEDNQQADLVLFIGTILTAFADFNAQPNVPIFFIAERMYALKMNSVALSFQGGKTVNEIMNYVCSKVNYIFVCKSEKIKNKVITDLATKLDYWTAIREIANQVGALVYVYSNVIVFINSNDVDADEEYARRITPVAEISRTTGMIGYPRYVDCNFSVDVIFSPNLACTDVVMLKVAEMGVDEEKCQILSISHAISTESTSSQWKTTLLLQRITTNVY